LYIATSSKSNSTITAIDSALEFIRNNETGTVPPHLRDTHYPGADEMGDGKGYKYPHAYQNNYVDQQYLPDGLEDSNFYQPNNNGYEVSVKKKLNYLKR
jgi:putative ATPase